MPRWVALREISPRTYIGSGRVERLKEQAAALSAGVIIIDGALSLHSSAISSATPKPRWSTAPGSSSEIFGRRAQTREGRLQVELARQGYERTRLVRTWTHLERAARRPR
ncbi:MAG: hypothetical protein WDM79_16585 [Terricaulis sp.]